MMWYTIVLKNSTYTPEMVSVFNNHLLNVVRIFQHGNDLRIEIFLSSQHHQLKASIQDILAPVMPEDQAIIFTVYEGVGPHSELDSLLYEGTHAHDDILDYYFSPAQKIDTVNGSRTIYSTLSIIMNVVVLVIFSIPLAVFIWQFNTCGLIFSIGFLAMAVRWGKDIAFSLKMMPNQMQILTLFGRKSIDYATVNSLEIRLLRGYFLIVEHTDGKFLLPIEQVFAQYNDREIIATIIQKAKLALVSGLSRNDCVFRPMQPYFDD